MNRGQFKRITHWQDKTFTEATALSKAEHLWEEVYELLHSVKHQQGATLVGEELADCFILLAGIANKEGFTYDTLCDAIERKFAIVQKRIWGEPDEKGVVRHIKS